MRDIVDRLRSKSGAWINGLYDDEAADEIERLRVQLLEARHADTTSGADAFHSVPHQSGTTYAIDQAVAVVDKDVRLLRDAIRSERNGDEALLRLALDALEYHRDQTRPVYHTGRAIEAIRARLTTKEN